MGGIEVDDDFVVEEPVSNWTTCLKELESAVTNVVGYGLFGSDLVIGKLGVLVFVVLPWLLGELSGDDGFKELWVLSWVLSIWLRFEVISIDDRVENKGLKL